jgi:response regulator RpfG family c-di-GMP phosphodiesterase
MMGGDAPGRIVVLTDVTARRAAEDALRLNGSRPGLIFETVSDMLMLVGIDLKRGALFHDIGKMAISDTILLQPDPLTAEEMAIMRQHAVYAYEMLNPTAYLRPAIDIPDCHCEKWDGSGHPRRLEKEHILLAARVFAVIDVWDTLRSDRPYRAAWPEEKVREYIRGQRGKHFDPAVVKACFTIIDEESP